MQDKGKNRTRRIGRQGRYRAWLTDNAVNKLETIDDEQYELLDLIPDFDE